jgi:hypothetical protein
MSKRGVITRLFLSQRERIKVRDFLVSVFRVRAKSPEERYRVLPGPDDSRSGGRQFHCRQEICLVPRRLVREGDSRGLNHPTRWLVSQPDNRNRGYKDEWDAVAGICNWRSFNFEDGAREYVRSPLPVCGNNGHEALGDYLAIAPLTRREIGGPSPQSSPRSRGEAIIATDPAFIPGRDYGAVWYARRLSQLLSDHD